MSDDFNDFVLDEQDRECNEIFHGDGSNGNGGHRYSQPYNKNSTIDDAKATRIAIFVVAAIYILAKLFE